MNEVLGVDIGGSGAKGAIVNVDTGELVSPRHKISTPQHVAPDRLGEIVAEIASFHEWGGPIGVAMPSIIRYGVVASAANIHDDWLGLDGLAVFEKHLGARVVLLNDADAAAVAESRLGAGKGAVGLMILLTLGTGIGSGFVVDGKLLPNTEIGHIEFKGMEAEDYAAASVRERLNLDWESWAGRVNEYLEHVVFVFSPSVIVLGGGVAKADEAQHWFPHIAVEHTRVTLAALRNNAGIVGAALAAADQ